MRKDVKVAIIGGSGLYEIDGLEIEEEYFPETPWGKPSDSIIVGKYDGTPVAFLARHGRGHFLNPSEVPARANIAALKSLGVEQIIAFSAVGSLREEIAPRHFVLPSQIIDRTKARPSTFFEEGVVVHVMFADPFSSILADLIWSKHATIEVPFHRDRTLICMEGPAFSTRAESLMYRQWGADIINMSVLPEAKLAREAEISYQMVCMSTDYDCWKVEEEPVTVEMVIGNLHANAENAHKLVKELIGPASQLPNPFKGTSSAAVITSPGSRNAQALKKLEYLFPDSFR